MAKATNYVGQTLGIWKVLQKTDERDSQGRIFYICENTKSKAKTKKTSNYLTQAVKRNFRSTKRGRPRKWVISKRPYIAGVDGE